MKTVSVLLKCFWSDHLIIQKSVLLKLIISWPFGNLGIRISTLVLASTWAFKYKIVCYSIKFAFKVSYICYTLPEKCLNTEFFLVRIFPHLDWIWRDTEYLSVFSPNAEKYGPEKSPYLDIFHALTETDRWMSLWN